MSAIVFRSLSVLAVIVSVLVAISFDFNSVEATKSMIDQIDDRPPGRIEPVPEFQPVGFVEFGEIRDPFDFKDSETGTTGNQSKGTGVSTSVVKITPADLSLLGLEADHALIKLPDGAVYLVRENDSLWGGDVIVQSISETGIRLMFSTSGEVKTFEKLYIDEP